MVRMGRDGKGTDRLKRTGMARTDEARRGVAEEDGNGRERLSKERQRKERLKRSGWDRLVRTGEERSGKD
jgi:hypothetical protein